jgi:hypothetical protein
MLMGRYFAADGEGVCGDFICDRGCNRRKELFFGEVAWRE